MTVELVREFLMSKGVSYEVHEHKTAYSAQQVAQAEHVSGHDVAKPVILQINGDTVMAVLPATSRVDLVKAAQTFGKPVRLAREDEFGPLFPDCELGAEPPFGNLYGIPVYVDKTLTAERMVFTSGDHEHAIHMSRSDYLALVDPTEVDIAF